MQFNLALHILLHIMSELHYDSGGVGLAGYRAEYQIPSSTFYRHVNSLIQLNIIKRVERDKYVISPMFYDLACELPKAMAFMRFMPDVQMEMFDDGIPF